MGAIRRKSRKSLTVVLLAAVASLAAAGCGSSYGSDPGTTGGDSPGGVVPDYQAPINKAKDTANQASQAQKQLEQKSNQMMNP